jgi:predicted SnoaL-like aldol condensation-catalyzing enzyme
MADSSVEARKRAAVDFLQLVVAGRIDDAYEKYVDMHGKHHNVFTATGFPALRKGMADNETQSPNKQITVKHVLGDGDLVAVHSQLTLRAGEAGMAVVHLFRFQGGKIVEMWDLGQAAPADSPNADGMF